MTNLEHSTCTLTLNTNSHKRHIQQGSLLKILFLYRTSMYKLNILLGTMSSNMLEHTQLKSFVEEIKFLGAATLKKSSRK